MAQERTASDEEIVVTGSVYRGEVASGGARIDADVKDLPISISVITKALIEDRQVRNLRELADNVAGVRSRASGSGAFTIDFTIRGLQGGNGSVTSVNGFRVENFSAGFDPQAVERVEFVKGPAAVLYGASGALSGLVNIVTKTARSDDFLILDVTGGQFGYGRAGIDANAQVSETLDVRLNAALTTEQVLNAFRDIHEQFVSPSVRWRPAEGVSVILEGSYFHATGPSRGVNNYPALARLADISPRLKLGERFDRNANTGYGLRFDASWEIADGVTIRQGVNLQDYREKDDNVRLGDFIAPNILERTRNIGDGKIRYLVSQTELRWNFDIGATAHTFLAGFEYGDEDFGGFCCDSAPIDPIDITNPVHGGPIPDLELTQLFANTIAARAFYLQDFIEIGDFRILAGLRHDRTKSTSGYCSTLDAGCLEGDPVVRNLGSAEETALSPRLGLVWQPSDYTTVFASFSRSFNPNPLLDAGNKLLPAERGIQYEIGIRQELLEPGQLTLSVSAFDLTRQNIADCDPAFPDCDRFVAIGEQRVKGVEVELGGKPVDWIDIIATYAFLDGEVTKSDEATTGIAVGSDLPEAARNSASVFAKVALTPLGLPEFAVSVGVYYVDERPGRNFFSGPSDDPLNERLLVLPASTRVDLGAYWEVNETLRFQANVTNLFDETILEPVNIGFNRAQPLRATVGATMNF